MRKTINVSDEVWEELSRMKINGRKNTLNEVIEELIKRGKRAREESDREV